MTDLTDEERRATIAHHRMAVIVAMDEVRPLKDGMRGTRKIYRDAMAHLERICALLDGA